MEKILTFVTLVASLLALIMTITSLITRSTKWKVLQETENEKIRKQQETENEKLRKQIENDVTCVKNESKYAYKILEIRLENAEKDVARHDRDMSGFQTTVANINTQIASLSTLVTTNFAAINKTLQDLQDRLNNSE